MSTWPPLPPPPPTVRKGRFGTKHVLLIALLVLVILGILWSLGKGSYHNYRIASAGVDHFHQQLDDADYDGIYQDAADEFRSSATRQDLTKFLRTVHDKMGKCDNRSAAGFHVNWKNGRVWVDQVFNIQCDAGQAQEAFVWLIQQNQCRLYHYQIDSPKLH
jgi:hypothetical protein